MFDYFCNIELISYRIDNVVLQRVNICTKNTFIIVPKFTAAHIIITGDCELYE